MASPTTTPAALALPSGFESVARFGDWVLPTEQERIEARLSRPYPMTLDFYNTMLAEAPRILPYLLSRSVASPTHEDENLLFLMFSFVEIANAVEIYGQSEVPDGADLRLFVSVFDGRQRPRG